MVPKGDNSGWRLITHLSFPKFNSVNFFKDPEESSVKYTSFDSVIQMIAKIGQGAFIAKCDIKSALDFCQCVQGILTYLVLCLMACSTLISVYQWGVLYHVRSLKNLQHF